jgi:hypothetical protein
MLRIYKSPKFDFFIMGLVIANTVVLMIKWIGEPRWVTNLTEILNYILAAFFTIDVFIKLSALGKVYFHDGWNKFDFIVILFTYVFIAIAKTTSFNLGPQASLLRSFRILKIFKYFKS